MTTEAEPLYTALDEALMKLMELNVEKETPPKPL